MFKKFSSLNYIYTSYLKAHKGRKKKKDVILYKQNLEENLLNLRNKIINFTYIHKKYNSFIVNDSKKRVINAPTFEDHILHHMVFGILEEIFNKKFIFHSYANRIGKGSHSAVLKLKKEIFKYDWYLKMDISKYFNSVNQDILFKQIERYVYDEDLLYYVKLVITSFPFDKGMPIGNVTSQLFANIYLHNLDFYVEHTLKPYFRNIGKDLFYIRYVDDFIFLGDDNNDLRFLRDDILNFLDEKLSLSVSFRKIVLNRTSNSVTFLGYILINKTKLKIRNDTIRRFKKKVKKYSDEKKLNSLISFKGHLDLCNTNLIGKLFHNLFLQDKTKFYKLNSQNLNLYDSTKRFNKKIQQKDSTKRFNKKIQQKDSAKGFSKKGGVILKCLENYSLYLATF